MYSDIYILCIGVLLAGIGGALINNNATPALILTEHSEAEKDLDRPLTAKEKQKLQSSVAAINTWGFGGGSIIGPILASLLDAYFGFRIAFTVVAFIVFGLSFLHLWS